MIFRKNFTAATKQEKPEKGKDASDEEVPEAYLNMDVCVGANYFKTGEDPVIRAESEYPEWLWGLIDQQEPGPDSKQYWRRIKKEESQRRLTILREKKY